MATIVCIVSTTVSELKNAVQPTPTSTDSTACYAVHKRQATSVISDLLA